jgi:hypothetical protein
MRAQKDFLLFAFLLPGLSLDGLVVTGGLRLAPSFLLKCALPFALRPPLRLCLFLLYPWNGLDDFFPFSNMESISATVACCMGEQQSQTSTSLFFIV